MAAGTAVVTGGGKGIGRAVTARLAAEGLRVVATGRELAALEEAAATIEGEVSVRRCDVTSEEQVVALFEELEGVDVLVNNAGISTSAPLVRTTLEDWQRQFEVNATGAFLSTREALPSMLDRGQGRIVTVASTAAHIGYRYTAAYTASKHAAVGLMRATAAEVAGTGVTANAVCPAFVRTEMTASSVRRIVAATGRSKEEAIRELERSSPLGRLLEPEEVAEAVAFFVSDAAAALNGQTLVLDGGGIQT
jgi:NAD(P)-dependent dehydrogenase (short-subunit alcohol dehydrogenase family)